MNARWPLPVVLPRLLLVSMTFALVDCNDRTPLLDNAALTTAPTSLTVPPPTPPSTPKAIELAPAGTMGGGTGRGTVFFDFPVPEGGVTVSLKTSDSVVAITPSDVTALAGSLSIDFSYATQAVAADKNVDIVASTAGRSTSARLGVWALLPTFFSYSSDRGAPVGGGRAGRLTPANARFDGRCSGSLVAAFVVSSEAGEGPWSVVVGAPPGVPLRPGVYENASDTGNGNYISIRADSLTSCRSIGRFTVHEADFTVNNLVRKFWATVEQACAGRQGTIRGDLRLTDQPPSSGVSSPCAL